MKICQNCNIEFSDEMNFCPNCGNILSQNQQFPGYQNGNNWDAYDEENFIRHRIMTLRQEGVKLPDNDFQMIQDLLRLRRNGLTAQDMFYQAEMLEDSDELKGAQNWFLLAMLEGHPDAKRRYKEASSTTSQLIKKGILFLTKLIRP